MERRILQLGRALEQAADEERWDEVRRVDARISQLLTEIRQRGRQGELQASLTRLREIHRRVAKICREEQDLLQMKIESHQQNRDRLMAYALFSDGDEGRE